MNNKFEPKPITTNFKTNPSSGWYLQNVGEEIAQLGFWWIALDYYRSALAKDPAQVQAWKESREILQELPENILIPNPIFIVGCGHSGTSLMLAILGHHPNVHPISKESSLFMKNNPSHINKTLLAWDKTCLELGKKRWVEKTPTHIFHIKRLLNYRPNSKIIILLRDGRDVVCSLKYRPEIKTFDDKLNRWIYDNMAGLPYWNSPQVKVVKYEDLVVNPSDTMKAVCLFLEEDYTPSILEYFKDSRYWYSGEITKPDQVVNKQDHYNLRNWQINQPIFDGRGRWKQEMSEEEKALFKLRAQKYLVDFGYVQDDNWD